MKLKIIFYVIIYELCIWHTCYSQPWSQISTTGSIPELKNHSAVYDPIADRILVFGGRNANGLSSNELWALRIANYQWLRIIPNGNSPAARYTQNAYFDSLNNRMIIWSGQGIELYNDVWAFNFGTNSWQQLWPDGNVNGVPLKRYGTASIFDPESRNIITFAGFTTSGRFEDTWTFHVDSLKWTDRTNNPHPPKRCLHSACFVNDQKKMVIYGGQDTGPLDDIWSLDLTNYTWQELSPAAIPPGRFFYSIIYTGSENLVVFGGLGTNTLGDMWKFSVQNNIWETVNQGAVYPAARWGHTAIYIPQSDRMIIFGGEGQTNYNDTWQFTNVSAIGINPISQKIPDKFLLYQNYPNPFNPTTKIKFNIPPSPQGEGGRGVRVTIYDVTGREIETLVNELLNPGTYEVDFDGRDLSSGVYFYTLVTANYNSTRKMVLLK